MQEQLYDQIGGRDAVEAVVSDFYDAVLGDERINHYFADQDMAELRAHQIQFISSVTGGPVDYGGEDMREAHAHLDLDEGDFRAVAEHLETALRDNGVSEANIEQILARVAELKAPVLDQ
ncbi:group I truncated hemoglobin [Haloarcula salina]|uniref:Group 1 truncated hemoglobin n=1 Tax=Haloarcula salina TaxID=1429914 RepID=A0AA41KJM2_9EURY|nr:group 1 truncated hemoglobin [Haloarcula salina]MBV0902918.1 group 1 truncated hemoglobin [Haloarcula salina]